MKKATKMIALAVAALTIVSCSDNKPVVEQPDLQLRLDGVPLTRYQGYGFEEGDVVGVYVVKRNASGVNDLLQNGNYADNRKFVYTFIKNGNTSTMYFLPEAGNEVYWNATDRFDIYSYFPYIENLNPFADIPFVVKENQSDVKNYAASDFLCAKSTNVVPTVDPVDLNYQHLLSQIRINLIPGDGYTNSDLINLLAGITIKDVITNVNINVAEGTSTSGSQRGNVIPYTDGTNKFAAIIPSQVITNAKTFVELNLGGKVVSIKTNMIIEAGKSYVVDLTIDKDFASVKMTLRGVYQWNEGDIHAETIKITDPRPANIKNYCLVRFDNEYSPVCCFDGATIGSFVCEPGKGHDYFDYAHKPNKRADITNGMEISVRFKNLSAYDNDKCTVSTYVDWNNDGDFEDVNEFMGIIEVLSGAQNSVQELKYTLNIPVDAISPTTMRIISGRYYVPFGCGKTDGTVYDVPVYF